MTRTTGFTQIQISNRIIADCASTITTMLQGKLYTTAQSAVWVQSGRQIGLNADGSPMVKPTPLPPGGLSEEDWCRTGSGQTLLELLEMFRECLVHLVAIAEEHWKCNELALQLSIGSCTMIKTKTHSPEKH